MVVLALGLLVVSRSSAQEPVEAWWLTATFSPRETSYDSLPVEQIDHNWLKLSALSYSILPAESHVDVTWMRRDGFGFQVDGFFKRKGILDRVLCGVFEDRGGQRGRFLLVLERKPAAASWKVAFLHQERGTPGFSVLRRTAGRLYWGTCMLCSDFSGLRMTRGRYYLEPVGK